MIEAHGANSSTAHISRGIAAMLGLFRRRVATPLSQASISLVRSHTRALIRCANVADTASSRAGEQAVSTKDGSKEWKAMASREAQLAGSIAAAMSGEVSMQIIVNDVIRPVLEEVVVLSKTADDAVTRAVSAAQRS